MFKLPARAVRGILGAQEQLDLARESCIVKARSELDALKA